MHLNHPQTGPSTPLPQPVENLSSMKPAPGVKKVGDCCSIVSSVSFFPFKSVTSEGTWYLSNLELFDHQSVRINEVKLAFNWQIKFLSDLPSGKIHFSHTSVFSSFPTMPWIFSNFQEGMHGCSWVCPPCRAPSFKGCINQCAGASLVSSYTMMDGQVTRRPLSTAPLGGPQSSAAWLTQVYSSKLTTPFFPLWVNQEISSCPLFLSFMPHLDVSRVRLSMDL